MALQKVIYALDWLCPKVVMIGMFLPPWNLFWWLVAFIFAKATSFVSKDKSGDGGLALAFLPGIVLSAPIHGLIWFLKKFES